MMVQWVLQAQMEDREALVQWAYRDPKETKVYRAYKVLLEDADQPVQPELRVYEEMLEVLVLTAIKAALDIPECGVQRELKEPTGSRVVGGLMEVLVLLVLKETKEIRVRADLRVLTAPQGLLVP